MVVKAYNADNRDVYDKDLPATSKVDTNDLAGGHWMFSLVKSFSF